MIRFVSVLFASVTLGAAAFAGPASAAPVQHYFGGDKDIVGDGPSPALDIYETLARYNTDGSILFVVTTTAPIDATTSDAEVAVSIGSSCNKLLGIGVGVFSKPTVGFVPKAKEKLKARKGNGEVTSNVFTFLVKHPTLAGWKPACYAVGLINPTDQKAAPYDQTDEIPMTLRA